MSTKNTRYNRAIIVAFIMILIGVELPYGDKAIMQYLIPVIRMKSDGVVKSSIYLSGLVPLVGLLWSYIEICKSKRFNSSGLAIFIIMFVIAIPFVSHNIHIIKAPIYYLNSGVKSIEVRDSNLKIMQEADQVTLEIDLEMMSYRDNSDGFQVAIVLSDTLERYVENEYLLISDHFRLGMNQKSNRIETLEIRFADGYENDDLFYSHLQNDDYKLILIDRDKSIELIRNDSY